MKREESKRYDHDDLVKAAEVIKKGGIILYPTDTIWGIGCDATNAEAIKKIYALKNREDSKSMLVLVASESALERVVEKVPETAWMLMETAVRPLTIIYDSPKEIASNLIADDGSLGIRITNELFSNALCRKAGVPIVSTSANISGQKSPSSFNEIDKNIIDGVDYVVKYRQDDPVSNKASNIIKVTDNEIIKVIR